MGLGSWKSAGRAGSLDVQVGLGVSVLSLKVGNSGRTSVLPLEAEFLLLQETAVFLIRPSADWMRPTHVEANLLYVRSTACER